MIRLIDLEIRIVDECSYLAINKKVLIIAICNKLLSNNPSVNKHTQCAIAISDKQFQLLERYNFLRMWKPHAGIKKDFYVFSTRCQRSYRHTTCAIIWLSRPHNLRWLKLSVDFCIIFYWFNWTTYVCLSPLFQFRDSSGFFLYYRFKSLFSIIDCGIGRSHIFKMK